MRVAAAVLAGASVLVLAACGYKGTVEPTAEGVSGTLPQQQTTTLPKGDPAAGKRLFASNGCSGCHTYAPAGSKAQIGPDLDKLPQYAKQAKQPLAAFVRESIVNPGAYIQKPYQNVMPTKYKSLPASDIQALVDFLTKPQG